MSEAAAEPRRTRVAPTLAVVGVAVALALGTALWWASAQDLERLDSAQEERAERIAEVTRLLIEQRVARGIAALRSVAAAGDVQQGVIDESRSAVLRALRPFGGEFSQVTTIVTDVEGEALGWSTPMAMLGFEGAPQQPLGSVARPRWEFTGGDLAVLMDTPIEDDLRVVGFARGIVRVGRLFVGSVSADLEVPVALVYRGEVVHHTFPTAPPFEDPGADSDLFRSRFEAQGALYDVAFRRLELHGETLWVGAGMRREQAEAAHARYVAVLGGVSLASLLAVLVAVGAFLVYSEKGERLRRQRDEERERSEGLSDRLEHLTAVVHDIKAPVSGIQLRCEGLVEDGPDTATRAALERIIDTCERLNLYLVNVLTAARAEEGGIPVEARITLAAGLIDEVMERVEPQAERKGVLLGSACDDELGALPLDPQLIERALVNLAANAIEVTPAGGRVSLYARLEADCAVIGVSDTGPGFRAFDPAHAFSQERPQVKDSSLRSGSTGFGLYIVGRIAAAHGGRAEARNLAGGGADVRMIFPSQQT